MNAGNVFSLIRRTTSDPTTIAKQLLRSWRERDYRAQFVRDRVQSSVALQIRALRDQRNGMTQSQLGALMGKAQPWISQIENPEYGKWSVATLLDCANAFDTDVEIRFRPFSRSLYELSHQDEQYFRVGSFEEELPELEQAATTGWVSNNGRWNDITRAAHLLYPTQGVSSGPGTRSSYAQLVVSQTMGVPSDYRMSTGSMRPLADRRLSNIPEELDRDKDKRRRGAKGALKRTAA